MIHQDADLVEYTAAQMRREVARIAVRPVYDCRRRSLRQMWGIYAGDVLTVITCRYPSKLMKEIVA